jgi:hypothetical protein
MATQVNNTFVTRKVREGWDDKRTIAISGHKTFAVFQRYNNRGEEDIKEVVLAPSPAFVYKNQATTFPHGAPIRAKVEDVGA